MRKARSRWWDIPLPRCRRVLWLVRWDCCFCSGCFFSFVMKPSGPFLAGASLILPFAKPHLLSLFWVALLLWILWRKKYAVAYGFAAALVAATAVAMAFDPEDFPRLS